MFMGPERSVLLCIFVRLLFCWMLYTNRVMYVGQQDWHDTVSVAFITTGLHGGTVQDAYKGELVWCT